VVKLQPEQQDGPFVSTSPSPGFPCGIQRELMKQLDRPEKSTGYYVLFRL